jgi:PAS domain-containing protein
MKTIRQKISKNLKSGRSDFFSRLWEESWTYIKTVVDILREPVLVLDKDFRVLAANERFYQSFQVEPKDTENKIVYELGDGQWNIPALKKLLENILPKNTFFKGFEVTHDFPSIGRKIMILNARQIHFREGPVLRHIILLAIEDVTEMMTIAETFAGHANQIEAEFIERTNKLEMQIERLEKDIVVLKSKI